MVEFVIGFSFSNRYSPPFVGAEQFRRASLVGNDMLPVVKYNDLWNVINNETYRDLQATALHSPFEMYLHIMECLLKSFSMLMGT